MADKREYIKLDIGYLSNPKIAGLLVARRPFAVLLHVECMTYSRQHRTDGRVPTALALRGVIGATKKDVTACIDAGLLVDLGDGTVQVHDYLEHQESAEQIGARSAAAVTANRARWSRAQSGSDRSNASGSESRTESELESGSEQIRNPEERRGEKRRTTPPSAPPAAGENDHAPADAVAETKPKATSRATRIPEPFTVTPDMVIWARENTPGLDHRAVTERFVDYWRAVAGKNGTKLDWTATWRNWLRREAESTRTTRPADGPRPGASVWDKRIGGDAA